MSTLKHVATCIATTRQEPNTPHLTALYVAITPHEEFGFPSSNNSENSDSETSVIDAEPMVEMQLSMTGVQVTTMRSKGGLKPLIPCLDDPVTKLEGVGDKTRRNLLDVRACAAALPFPAALPEDCPNTVTTGLPSYPR